MQEASAQHRCDLVASFAARQLILVLAGAIFLAYTHLRVRLKLEQQEAVYINLQEGGQHSSNFGAGWRNISTMQVARRNTQTALSEVPKFTRVASTQLMRVVIDASIAGHSRTPDRFITRTAARHSRCPRRPHQSGPRHGQDSLLATADAVARDTPTRSGGC